MNRTKDFGSEVVWEMSESKMFGLWVWRMKGSILVDLQVTRQGHMLSFTQCEFLLLHYQDRLLVFPKTLCSFMLWQNGWPCSPGSASKRGLITTDHWAYCYSKYWKELRNLNEFINRALYSHLIPNHAAMWCQRKLVLIL